MRNDIDCAEEIATAWVTRDIEVHIKLGALNKEVSEDAWEITPQVAIELSEVLRESADRLIKLAGKFDVLN